MTNDHGEYFPHWSLQQPNNPKSGAFNNPDNPKSALLKLQREKIMACLRKKMAICVLYPVPGGWCIGGFPRPSVWLQRELQTALLSIVVAMLSCIAPWGNSILFSFLTVPQMVSWQHCTAKCQNKIKS